MSAGSAYGDGSVLVTGAQGFIGSWLVERLLEQGARVVVPARPAAEDSRFRRQQLDGQCEVVGMDLLDFPSVLRALNEYDVRLVFHLAAQTIVSEANGNPMGAFDTNVRGTYNLLEACRVLAGPEGAPRVVVASSYHAYGRQAVNQYTERTPLRPSYPYEVSKASADIIARCYAATYAMPVALTRIANVYGGGDLNWSRLVPGTARALANGERPVIASDGSPERDYLYVEDAIDAYLAVAASLEAPTLNGRAWNAGVDRAVSVLDVVETLIRVSGKEIEPEIRGRARSGGPVDAQFLDSSAIREELDWSPKWELERGLAASYDWYDANLT